MRVGGLEPVQCDIELFPSYHFHFDNGYAMLAVINAQRQHPFTGGGKDLEGHRMTSKDILSSRIKPGTSSSQCSIVCVSSLQRRHSGFAQGCRRLT